MLQQLVFDPMFYFTIGLFTENLFLTPCFISQWVYLHKTCFWLHVLFHNGFIVYLPKTCVWPHVLFYNGFTYLKLVFDPMFYFTMGLLTWNLFLTPCFILQWVYLPETCFWPHVLFYNGFTYLKLVLTPCFILQ